MGAVTLPRRPLTRADLEAMPDDDGHRYELVDGVLVVTPAPSTAHQTVSVNLLMLLGRACPSDLRILHAPFDVVLSDDTLLQPDLVVARRADFTAQNLPTAPLLAIEILSPSTRRFDLMVKRSRLESAGCASYWVVDPDIPSMVAWDLDGASYREVGNVKAAEMFRAVRPFEVEVRPADLIL
jgi:Uma2 family endonuclease